MEKPFVYGKSVSGDNFTDRVKESKRLKLDFENGINVVLISPRRMGKTSLVKKVAREYVGGQSSYIQQLAWNVLAETETEVTSESFDAGIDALMQQCASLFTQQTISLSTYQMNYIRALCAGIHDGFGSKKVMERFPLGSKSNITRIKNTLIEREMIEETPQGVFLTDAVFEKWFVMMEMNN